MGARHKDNEKKILDFFKKEVQLSADYKHKLLNQWQTQNKPKN